MLGQLLKGELKDLLAAAKIPFKSNAKKQELIKAGLECRSDLMNLEIIKKYHKDSINARCRKPRVLNSEPEDGNATVSRPHEPEEEQPTLSSSTEIQGVADADMTFWVESLPTPMSTSSSYVSSVNYGQLNPLYLSGRPIFREDERVEGIRMTESPFYEVLEVLIPHTLLTSTATIWDNPALQQTSHSFALTKAQLDLFSNEKSEVKVQLRFFKYDPASDPTTPQGDRFPLNLAVQVNDGVIYDTPTFGGLPASEAQLSKIPSAPLIVRHMRTHGSNNIHIRWDAKNPARSSAFILSLVRKVSVDKLLKKILDKVLNMRETVKLIKVTASPSSGTGTEGKNSNTAPEIISPGTMKITVLCPITKQRMTWPCRGKNCSHIPCFDAKSFVMMCERKPYSPFRCPLCNEIIKLEDLRIDGYFTQVLEMLSPSAENVIELLRDGTWRVIDNGNPSDKGPSSGVELVDLASTQVPVPTPINNNPVLAYRQPECIYLD
ncbi:unnamed protein product [Orchesella dallaii]